MLSSEREIGDRLGRTAAPASVHAGWHGRVAYAGRMTSTLPSHAGLDPALFRPEAIDPETAAFNDRLAGLLAQAPPIWSRPAAETRAARAAGGPFGPLVLSQLAEDRTISGPGGALRVRTIVPQTVTGVYLHIHGGGFALGAPEQQDVQNERLAHDAELAVVSVEYRLTPEHPYPAAPDDCEAAAAWLVEHAQAEFGTSRLFIGGESAGGHLSVTTLLRLRERHGAQPFAAANLVYGVYDLAFTPSAMRDDTLLVDHTTSVWFHDQYVPAERRREPDVSPLWADLHGLPPALFSVGTLDLLIDDTLFMYSRWVAAGNPAELALYPGAPHGFTNFPYGLARRAHGRAVAFLRRH